jgi:signal transduction histidine kinase
VGSEAKKRINWKRQALAAERLRYEIVSNWQSKQEPVRMDLLALGVAHEFNNILGAALGHADWALESQTPEDMKDALEIIRIACLRCAQITKSLQGVTQPREEGKAIFELKDLFSEVLRLWDTRAEKSGVLVQFESSQSRVYLDASAFVEIFSNLIKNSFEILEKQKQQGKITISCEENDSSVIINYRDSGPGIPQSYRPYVFQPFFSTKGTISAVYDSEETKEVGSDSPNPKNSGLGLFLSRKLAQEMGGDMRLLDTPPGEGVQFEITLPLVK